MYSGEQASSAPGALTIRAEFKEFEGNTERRFLGHGFLAFVGYGVQAAAAPLPRANAG